MNYALQYLAHMVIKKNEINRRRRRFYSRANPRYSWRTNKRAEADKVYSKEEALAGYEKAKDEMRALTPLMRQLCKDAGAYIVWGDSGNIQALRLRCENDRFIKLKEVAMLACLYEADKIILGE